MANTTKLKEDVEIWYRNDYLKTYETKEIIKEKVLLKWGGTFEFDAVVRENNRIVEVHCLSTSKYNTAQLHKIKDDALMLTAVSEFIKKIIAFTDISLYNRVKEEQLNGRFPLNIDLVPIENLPDRIKKTIAEIRKESENEQKQKLIQ